MNLFRVFPHPFTGRDENERLDHDDEPEDPDDDDDEDDD